MEAGVLSLSLEDQLMLRIACALAIYCTAVSVDAAMLFKFEPALTVACVSPPATTIC